MTKKIIDWGELENAEDVFSKTVLCPNLSKAMGEDVYVKVRAIDHMEFLGAIDMPMDEINQMVGENADPEAFTKAVQEQAKALGGLASGYLFTMVLIYALLAIPLRSYAQPSPNEPLPSCPRCR